MTLFIPFFSSCVLYLSDELPESLTYLHVILQTASGTPV